MTYILSALALIAALWGVYAMGESAGQAHCQAAQGQANQKAEVQQKAQTQATVTRAAKTGAAFEDKRAALDQFYNQLESEAAHAPSDPVDECVLPADRLRAWAAANAGAAHPDSAASQPHSPAPEPAAPALGADTRPGGQPPAGGPAVPPAGGPALRAPGVFRHLPWDKQAALPPDAS